MTGTTGMAVLLFVDSAGDQTEPPAGVEGVFTSASPSLTVGAAAIVAGSDTPWDDTLQAPLAVASGTAPGQYSVGIAALLTGPGGSPLSLASGQPFPPPAPAEASFTVPEPVPPPPVIVPGESGIDAEMIDTLPAGILAAANVLFFYGSPFGSTQGPARVTPAAFVNGQLASGKPCWGIYFPGCDPAQAYAQAMSAPADTGVVMDLEPEFEQDAQSLIWCQQFGAYMLAHGMPCAIYSHQATCEALAAYYDAQWWDGQGQPTVVPVRTAIQYGQQVVGGTPYDTSACDTYFLTAAPAPPPPPSLISLAAFVAQDNGQLVTVPGWPTEPECTDLALSWLMSQGISGGSVHGNAVQWASESIPGCQWIPNSPTNMPAPGDVPVWGPYAPLGVGADGHVDIAYQAIAVMSFLGFDQNWPTGSLAHLQTHSYGGVLGWQHPTTGLGRAILRLIVRPQRDRAVWVPYPECRKDALWVPDAKLSRRIAA
jgi:hypothetical protein